MKLKRVAVPGDDIATVKEVAEEFKVDQNRLYRGLVNGTLTNHGEINHKLVSRAEVRSKLEELTQPLRGSEEWSGYSPFSNGDYVLWIRAGRVRSSDRQTLTFLNCTSTTGRDGSTAAFTTARLRQMVEDGRMLLESPVGVLELVISTLYQQDRIGLAADLEQVTDRIRKEIM